VTSPEWKLGFGPPAKGGSPLLKARRTRTLSNWLHTRLYRNLPPCRPLHERKQRSRQNQMFPLKNNKLS
jgi:hypothetical protein